MSSLFPQWTNSVFRLVLAGIVLVAMAAVVGPMICVRTSYINHVDRRLEQPIEFDHRHHVRDDGIPCLYCHSAAASGPSAGVPTTELCMGCHAQIWRNSPLLEMVRRSYFSGQPIVWNRVHRVPDFVFFHHGIHVQSGIDCTRCHGNVDTMARVYRAAPLSMSWCLDCHRRGRASPAHVPDLWEGLRGTVFEAELGYQPIERPLVLTTCSTCHR